MSGLPLGDWQFWLVTGITALIAVVGIRSVAWAMRPKPVKRVRVRLTLDREPTPSR